jgi:hypothetical protein
MAFAECIDHLDGDVEPAHKSALLIQTGREA